MRRLHPPAAKWIGWVLAGCLFPLASCSDRLAGGGASEAGNAVGRVLDATGKPAAGVRFKALPVGFDPLGPSSQASCDSAVSGAEGRYTLRCRDIRPVNLIGTLPGTNASVFIRAVQPSPGAGTQVPDDTLSANGRIKVFLPEDWKRPGSYVYAAGTEAAAVLDAQDSAAGFVMLDSVPEGKHEGVLLAVAGDTAKMTLATEVTVAAGDSTVISPFASWPYSRSIRINTTVSGAFLPAGVGPIPLLLRLDSARMDFGRARRDGSDIRFAKPDGTPLPFRIQSWKADSSEALVWVRVDTVLGNSSDQSLRMYWGNPGAAAAGPLRAVFDTGDGFSGVWHLEEEFPDTGRADAYADGTPGGTAGFDRVRSPSGSGIVGAALHLKGGEYVDIRTPRPLLMPAATLTLSAWVKVDSLDQGGSTILTFGDSYSLLAHTDSSFLLNYNDTSALKAVETSRASRITGSGWRHLAATFDGTDLRIYLDGVLAGSNRAPGRIDYTDRGKPWFRIGTHGSDNIFYNDYYGAIDEVAVSRVVRGGDWVKLAFENQRPGSTLLEFLPP